jgi:hypothetical protein
MSDAAQPRPQTKAPPHLFVDTDGRRWTVYDFHVVRDRRRRVPIGDYRAEGRAFVPDGWTGDVLIYRFGAMVYRTTEPKILAGQLSYAKPLQPGAPVR